MKKFINIREEYTETILFPEKGDVIKIAPHDGEEHTVFLNGIPTGENIRRGGEYPSRIADQGENPNENWEKREVL